MQEKRVLVITNMYPSQKHKSFGVFVKNQVEELRRKNLSIDVLAIINPKNGKINIVIKYTTWVIKTFFILITKGWKYNLIHAHYVFPSGYLAILFKRLFGTRVILTAHGGDIDKMARKNEKIFLLTKKILHEADHIIAVGQDLRNQIANDFYVEQQKISTINMGVNRHIFKPRSKQEARETYKVSKNEKMILFVGNVIEQKGLSDLIAAIHLLQNKEEVIKLYIIGAERDSVFKDILKRQIDMHQMNDNVRWLGVKNQSEVALWMNAADCLVLPSHIEGFGLVALEAMSCGTPVVGTDVGGLKYLLANGAGIITPIKDVQKLADSLQYILSSKQEREQLIMNGIKKAEENDQERLIEQVLEVYFPTGERVEQKSNG